MDLGIDLNLADPFGSHARSSEDRAYANDERRMNIGFQREDNALVRRVADANAAGLHPLATLGTSISGPVISSSGGGGSGGGSSVRVGTSRESDLERANTRLINKQADLVDEQIAQARLDRISRQITPDKTPINTRLPGGVDLPGDPAFITPDQKYGEISDLDGLLARFLDNVSLTQHNLGLLNDWLWSGFNSAKKHPYTKDDPVFTTHE